MVKQVSVYSCASVLAVLVMVSAFAEITGSGFRNTDCSGAIHVNLWMDSDGDGMQSRTEPVLSNADIYVSVTGFPAEGVDKFTTDLNGTAKIDSLCKGTYTLEIDEETILRDSTLDSVFELGTLIIDGDVNTEIAIDLNEGWDFLAPGERYLDIAFGPATRGLR